MRHPRPLPPGATTGAHLLRDAPALGLDRGRTRRRDIARRHHGVWTAEPERADIVGRCTAYAPRLLPGQVFSHQTALALVGAPVVVPLALHVSVLFPRTPPRERGVRGHSLRVLDAGVAAGLPSSPPASAWVESAALCSADELVALGDYLVSGAVPGLGPDELLDALHARPRARHVARAWWAFGQLRPGVRSRPESLLRVAVVRAGMPEPVIEHPIRVEGRLVLHPDLVFVRERVVLEYEGDAHRIDRATWMRDLRRRELLEAAGWRVIRVTADDLFRDLPAFLDRLRRILASRR